MVLVCCLLKSYYLLLKIMKYHYCDCSPLKVMVQTLIKLSGVIRWTILALLERKGKGLVNVSTCNFHVCHNAFQKGLQVFSKTSLNLSLVCIYGLSCLLPDMKIMKKFKESLACRFLNFWNMLNEDDSLWLQLCCELLNSLMVLKVVSATFFLICFLSLNESTCQTTKNVF